MNLQHISEYTATELYDWYTNIEHRLLDIIKVLPIIDASELNLIQSPRLASILLEAASLVDALFRSQLPEEFERGKKHISRNEGNIIDYQNLIEPNLLLSESKSVLIIGIPKIVRPFAPWKDTSHYTPLSWWKIYNSVKHDRLTHSKAVTLEHCIYATCALKQLMMKIPSINRLAFRHGWIQFAGYNPIVAINELNSKSQFGYAAYTDFFATFLFANSWESVDDIRPIHLRNRERLESYLGRMGTLQESLPD